MIPCFTGASAQPSLQKPFDECGIDGSITIYDYKLNKWITNDIDDSHYATLPASTFKIVNTLIALESGAVADENEIISWINDYDTVRYGHRPDIYHSMSMKEAFKLSAGWVYVELAKRIGKEKYREYLTKINYGNVNLSSDDPDFWNFGEFGISPSGQIDILIGIYEESLPFSERSFRILKEMMIEERSENHMFRAKTGWTGAKGKDIGWWVGYVEQSGNVYFFATRLIKDRAIANANFAKCRKEITRAILKQLEILD